MSKRSPTEAELRRVEKALWCAEMYQETIMDAYSHAKESPEWGRASREKKAYRRVRMNWFGYVEYDLLELGIDTDGKPIESVGIDDLKKLAAETATVKEGEKRANPMDR